MFFPRLSQFLGTVRGSTQAQNARPFDYQSMPKPPDWLQGYKKQGRFNEMQREANRGVAAGGMRSKARKANG